MSSIIGSAIGTVLATKLPFDNATNIALGMTGGQLVTLSLDRFTKLGGWIWSCIGFNRNTIRIYANEGGRFNPIYKKMEEYILEQYTQQLTQCNLEPIKGEVSIGLREAIFMTPITVQFKHNEINHTLNLTLLKQETTVDTSTSSSSSKSSDDTHTGYKTAKTIEITSKTASVEILKNFVTHLVKLEKKQSNILTVYRAVGLKKDQTPNWDCLRFKSNKTIENTILRKQTEDELFIDIDWFMNNEHWYTEKGIDYKRGYLLHGPPGTGKTSSIKAIANKYSMPIFSLDLESIKTNNQLITLANDILYESPDKPYILAIEDFDRHEMFLDKWTYNSRQKKVTLQCLLNVIDGVVESHGRILIITCNDKQRIEEIGALVRPGRIDRAIEIGYLDGHQTSRLINNYFNVEIDILDEDVEECVTPAQLIKKMQTSHSLENTLYYICKDHAKIKKQLNNEEGADIQAASLGLLELEKMEKPEKLSSETTKSSRIRNRRRKYRRNKNPGKNPAEKRAWAIKQKEKKVANLTKNNNALELTRRKIELELEYDKKTYTELRQIQDKRDAIKKEKELQKKKREREKKKREREKEKKTTKPIQINKRRKVVTNRMTNAENVIHTSYLQNITYKTRSGRTIKPVMTVI